MASFDCAKNVHGLAKIKYTFLKNKDPENASFLSSEGFFYARQGTTKPFQPKAPKMN